MARRFDGGSATDRISSSSGGTFAVPWSIGCWINVIAYATGRCIAGSGTTDTTGQMLRTGVSTAQRFAGRNDCATSDCIWEIAAGSTGIWQCVIVACSDATTAASNKIFLGTLSTPMADTAHASDTNGSGATTGNGNVQIGKTGTASTAVNADIAQAFGVPFAMTVDEAERFRQGDWSVLFKAGVPHFFAPMENGGAALRDLARAFNYTATSTPTIVEDPPIAFGLARTQGIPVHRRAPSNTPLSVDGGITPTGAAPKTVSKQLAGAFT